MESLAPIIDQLLAVFFFLATAVGLNYGSVEGIKQLIRWIESGVEEIPWLAKILGYLSLSGRKTFIFSLVMAFGIIAGFDINLFANYSQFEGIDPLYAQLAQSALTSLLANWVADRKKTRQILNDEVELRALSYIDLE